MAYPPGTFSVCLIYHDKDASNGRGANLEYHKIFRITFATRSISDEWWRAGSKFLEALIYPAERKYRFGIGVEKQYVNRATFQRISPQWYHFYGGGGMPELDWFLDEAWSEPFRDKMFILGESTKTASFLLKEAGMTPQGFFSWMGMGTSHGPTNGTEPISGNWYYIRSFASPHEYWHIHHATHVLCVSRFDRTRFRLDIVPTPASPESNPDAPSSPGTVIIPSDAITLTASKNGTIAHIITRDPGRNLLYHGFHTDTEVTFARTTGQKLPGNDRGRKWWLFKDFIDRFGVVRGNDTKSDVLHLLSVMPEGEGESWQLV